MWKISPVDDLKKGITNSTKFFQILEIFKISEICVLGGQIQTKIPVNADREAGFR